MKPDTMVLEILGAGRSLGRCRAAARRHRRAGRWHRYANIFEAEGLYGILFNPGGTEGTISKLQTLRPLYHSDGLRAYGSDRLLMVEGETKGDLDLITLNGDSAKVETLKGGFEGPVSLAQVDVPSTCWMFR